MPSTPSTLKAATTPSGARRLWRPRGWEGKIQTAHYARTHKVPYLGICLGMQVATIEYARTSRAWLRPTSTEFDRASPTPCIALIDEWQDADGTVQNARCQQRPGRHHAPGGAQLGCARLARWRTAFMAMWSTERHRHRYEVNDNTCPSLREAGLVTLPYAARAADRDR